MEVATEQQTAEIDRAVDADASCCTELRIAATSGGASAEPRESAMPNRSSGMGRSVRRVSSKSRRSTSERMRCARCKQGLPGCGRSDRPHLAVDELELALLLELFQTLRDGRLGRAEMPCGIGNASLLANRHEGTQAHEIELSHPMSIQLSRMSAAPAAHQRSPARASRAARPVSRGSTQNASRVTRSNPPELAALVGAQGLSA